MKRTLSFIVAFLMVFTVFAVSDPFASADAASLQEWALPTDWTTGVVEQYKGWDIPVQGPWKLLGFSDLDAATPVTNDDANIVEYSELPTYNQASDKDKTPFPYMGTNNNEQKAQNNSAVSKYTANNWYVNYGARWGGMIFSCISDSSGLNYVGDAGQAAAIVFTAPADGLYGFSELVTGILFETSISHEALSFTATVRKNGEILATFTPTTEMTSDILQGEVELKAGDMLMFAFEQTTEVVLTAANTGNNDPACLTITNLSVWTTVEGGDETTGGGNNGGDQTTAGGNNGGDQTTAGGNNGADKGEKAEEDKPDMTVAIIACAVAGVAVAGAVVCAIVVAKRRKG